MIDIVEMQKLIKQLNYYTKLYDEGNPQISDAAWDELYFQLQKMEQESGIVLANSPTSKIDYQVVNSLNKVNHNHPMLSLEKTKSIDDIVSFFSKQDGIAMAKMDGLTCSITYQNGKIIRAETRGNGLIGEDITHNIYFVNGVPTEIPFSEELVIDGEVICTYSDFEDFSEEYKNPRNFASGSIRLLDSRASAKRKLTFVAWDCVSGIEKNSLSQKLGELKELGFFVAPYLPMPVGVISKDFINDVIENIKEKTKILYYPIDGIVFKYNNCEYYNSLGTTEHHPRGGIAFKFYDEEYETVLRNIEYTIGKTGALTPVAIFDPVETDSNIITRASLHNLSIMKSILGERPYIGQKIKVFLANQIIPQISYAEKEDSLNYEI